jgi:hypothetical protein
MKEAYKGVQAAHLVVRDQLAICRFLGRKVQFADLRAANKAEGKPSTPINKGESVLDIDSDDMDGSDLGFDKKKAYKFGLDLKKKSTESVNDGEI